MMTSLSNLKTRPYVKSQRTDNIKSYPVVKFAKVLSFGNEKINCKERWVYCEHCKYLTLTNYSGPICGECGSNMITVSKNELD